MKTKKFSKMVCVILTVVILSILTTSAFADNGMNRPGKDRFGRHHEDKFDWLEDWFEHRIEARACLVEDTVPANASDEEVLQFFADNFLNNETTAAKDTAPAEGTAPADPAPRAPEGRRGRCDDDRFDWLEEWFERRIEAREQQVEDTLSAKPTNDEIIDFFKTNFLN